MNRRWIFLGAPLAAFAQNSQNEEVRIVRPQGGEHMIWMSAGGGPQEFAGSTFQFIAAEGGEARLVKNAPYTGEANTETTRVLADGTRIVSKSATSVARDKEGRMRRDNNFSNIGPWVNSNQQPPRLATITDPVARETYVLNLNDKTARKMKMGELMPMVHRKESSSGAKKEVFEHRVQVTVRSSESGADVIASPPGLPATGGMVMRIDSKNSKTENLGRQTMEGVPVDGTRTTVTIPAGEIGNDRPIVSVTERWYSADLQMVIYSRTNDPQFGESIYRVTNLRRAEPDPGLFKVPADYKVEEASRGQMIHKKVVE